MNEIFGESQFIGLYLWNKSQNPPSLSKSIRHKYEYILGYFKGKHEEALFGGLAKGGDSPLFNGSNKVITLNFPPKSVSFKIRDGIYKAAKSSTITLNNYVTIKNGLNENSFSITGPFRWKQETLMKEIGSNTKIIIKSENFAPRYQRNGDRFIVPSDLITNRENAGTNEDARKQLEKLIGRGIFTFPKPTGLLKYLIEMGFHLRNDITVMDFFAGSSTTADAVMQLNAKDGGHRKFIMVQLPEKTYHTNKDGKEIPTKGGKAAYEAGFKSVDQISRERIRRAAKKIRQDNELTLPKDFDGSFKHYRVVKPVKQTLEEIDDFDPNNTNLFTDMVNGFSSKRLGIEGDATGEQTILTTWLAKDGYSFEADVEEVMFDNYSAHKVEDNRLYLINEGWGAEQTKELLNQLGTHQLEVQSVVIFGYSFNVAELRELESGLKQLDSKVTLIKRY